MSYPQEKTSKAGGHKPKSTPVFEPNSQPIYTHTKPNTHPATEPNIVVAQSYRKPTYDPSEPPNYDYNRDRGRKIRMRAEEQCVFNHSTAENNPLLDLKHWREKLKILRALPKPTKEKGKSKKDGKEKGGGGKEDKRNTNSVDQTENAESTLKRTRNKAHKHGKGGKKTHTSRKTNTKHKGSKLNIHTPSVGDNEELSDNTGSDSGDSDHEETKGRASRKYGDNLPVEDTDHVTFTEILDPRISTDTRYERYLDELQKDHNQDRADLQSLYKQQFEKRQKQAQTSTDNILRHDFEYDSDSNGFETIHTEQNQTTPTTIDENELATLVANMPAKKQISVSTKRSISTDPEIQITGSHGVLHPKPAQNESRLSLNNFKLRLNLPADESEQESQWPHGGVTPRNTPRNTQHSQRSVLESEAIVSQEVKLVNYVTKQNFSPRRNGLLLASQSSLNSAQKLSNSTTTAELKQKEQESLRKGALHLPTSTNFNGKSRATLAATKTSETKGGGWKVPAGAIHKRDVDFHNRIPISVTGNVANQKHPQMQYWKVDS